MTEGEDSFGGPAVSTEENLVARLSISKPRLSISKPRLNISKPRFNFSQGPLGEDFIKSYYYLGGRHVCTRHAHCMHTQRSIIRCAYGGSEFHKHVSVREFEITHLHHHYMSKASKPQPSPRTSYVFTLNNYTLEEEDKIKACSFKSLDYLCFGYELSKKGTPHLQGYITLLGKGGMYA